MGGFSSVFTNLGISLYNGRVADVNHDGVSDLVCNSGTQVFSVLQGTGAGTYLTPMHFTGGALVDVNDMNGDGHVDAVSMTMILTGGVAFAPAPIPPDPQLAGNVYFAQSVWVQNPSVGHTCSSATLGLLSSRGLQVNGLP